MELDLGYKLWQNISESFNVFYSSELLYDLPSFHQKRGRHLHLDKAIGNKTPRRHAAVQRPTAVSAYLKRKQLLLFVFAW